jgi:hypothetical protein
LLIWFRGDIGVMGSLLIWFRGDISVIIVMFNGVWLLVSPPFVGIGRFALGFGRFAIVECNHRIEERYVLPHTRRRAMWLTFLKDNVTGDKHAAGPNVLDLVVPTPTCVSQESTLHSSRVEF